MSRQLRSNLFIAAWICIILGTGIFFADITAGLMIGAPIAVGGGILLLLALARVDEPVPMSDSAIKEWAPEGITLPEGAGGRVMYRADTTLDEPIRTSVLCGACGNVTWLEGQRPTTFTCDCGILLWEHSEEE